MIVSNAVRDHLSQIRPGPDPVLAEVEEHGAREGIPIVVAEGRGDGHWSEEPIAGVRAFNQRLQR